MTNSARFSMRLELDLKEWLEREAKRTDRSAAYIAASAIAAQKERSEARQRILDDAVREAEEGSFISEEAMTAWFLALGTDHEFAEPEPDIFEANASR